MGIVCELSSRAKDGRVRTALSEWYIATGEIRTTHKKYGRRMFLQRISREKNGKFMKNPNNHGIHRLPYDGFIASGMIGNETGVGVLDPHEFDKMFILSLQSFGIRIAKT